MIRRPPRSTRTGTLFPYPTLFRSERVDQPEAVALDDGCLAGRHGLLGDHRDIRRQGVERAEDEGLGGLVGLGDRRGVVLPAHLDLRGLHVRSEGRRVGTDGVRTGRSWWSPGQYK